jgi:hypothetical protein
VRARALLGLAALVCAACGGGQAGTSTAAAREWRSNALGALTQLQQDVTATSVGGTTRADAAHALADTSDLFGLLVAYSDLGGCRAMIAATTAPPLEAVKLARPCRHLQRAAALFTRATARSDPDALVRAGREARLAEPQLVRALADLHRRR